MMKKTGKRIATAMGLLAISPGQSAWAALPTPVAPSTAPAAGDWIELTEARNLIAAQCGTAPEVLSRTFRRLEDDGVFTARPDAVVIDDPASILRCTNKVYLAELLDLAKGLRRLAHQA